MEIKSRLLAEDCTLYALVLGRRIVLGQGTAEIELLEDKQKVNILGKNNPEYKINKITVALCNDIDLTRDVTEQYIRNVSGFDIEFKIQRTDGVFENFSYNDIDIIEMDIEHPEKWKFELRDRTNRLWNI